MNQELFLKILTIVAAKDTSADPEGWTPANPLWGHCAVVSLMAQDYFGGVLVRGSLEGISKYAYLRSHFWNRLPEGEIDFTAAQFGDLKCDDLPKEVRPREHVLCHPDTQRRYALLKSRFENGNKNMAYVPKP